MKDYRQLFNILTLMVLLTSFTTLAEDKNEKLRLAMKELASANFQQPKKLDFASMMRESVSKNLLPKKIQIIQQKENAFGKPTNRPAINVEFNVGGADIGGGGDWEKSMTEEYPKRDFLAQALQLAYEQIENSSYPEIFRTLLIDELQNLAKNNKFKFTPALFFIEQSVAGQKNDQHDAIEEFGSLGAFTAFKPGAQITFSSRTLDFTIPQFSKLITHEIIHHILSYSLTKNEDLVSTLTDTILGKKNLNPSLASKITNISSLQDEMGTGCKLTDPLTAEKIIHYELDRVSPYSLAEHDQDNTMQKISDLTLNQLSILARDSMWTLINRDLIACGFSAISKRNQSHVSRAGDIMSLVTAKLYRQDQVTFSWKNSEDAVKKTGIISQIITLKVD